jgi:hypothetical protein
LQLLFWLSLIPFVTGWMGENHFVTLPVALYGPILPCAAGAHCLLQRLLIKAEGPDCLLARAVGGDWMGNLSPPDLCGRRSGQTRSVNKYLAQARNFLQFGLCAS